MYKKMNQQRTYALLFLIITFYLPSANPVLI